MSIARRSFLKSATMSTLSAGLVLSGAQSIFGQKSTTRQTRRPGGNGEFQVPISAQRDALFSFRASTFSPYVGDIFQAPNSRGEMVELTLARVSEYKLSATGRSQARNARQPQSFSLTFNASAELPPLTSIHKVSHPALGQFDVFLTHRKSDDGTLIYEAVFNHI